MCASHVAKLSVDEYLSIDRAAEVKSEYHDGEMFPLQAATYAHAMLCTRVGLLLEPKLAPRGCHVVGASLRVRVSPSKFLIPDVLVICGKAEFADQRQDTIINPKVIVEVLSPSTANYDFGYKFTLYRRLSSFQEYILVSQDQARVETFQKRNKDEWVLHTFEGLEASAPIECVGVSLPLAQLYEGIDLISEPDDQ